jgi:DNA-directed RNA polymerase specialized sigma subunit
LTNDDKIKYLRHYRYINTSIPLQSGQVAKFEHWADLNISPKVTDKCLSIAKQMQKEIQQLEQDREQIETAIDAVTDDCCRDLLRYRYLEQLTWEQIAHRLHYCNTYVYKLHKQALAQVVIP